MKTMKVNRPVPLSQALRALKSAILEGATWRYEQSVATAMQAGATDEQIDCTAHEAMEALFAQAEQPVTSRQLTQLCTADHSRY